MNHHQNLITNYGMQSPRFFVTETDSRFNHQKQLTVTEAGRAVKVETDLPHLVSLGSGRFSTAVTLHPLPEGKTTVGCMNADIIIRGRGIHPEHCYFIHERDVVVLFPISQLITVDGAKVTRPTILSQGSMICFGRSSYFRFNHPAEAQHLKEEHFDIYSETYSTAGMFSKREPLYANEEMSTSSATSTTEGSASIPLYDNVAEIRSSRDRKIDDPQGTPSDTLTPLSPEPDRGSLHGTRSPFFPSFAAFPDGSRRPADGGFRGNEFVVNVATSDLFDEKASHIPRPLSPFECVTSCTWSGYDNVLELKESMRRLETKEERRGEDDDPRSAIRDCQPPPGSALPLIRCTDRFSPVTVGVFIGEVVNSSSNKNNNKNIDNDKNNNKSNNFDEDNINNNNVNNNNISNININSSSSSMDRVLAIKKQFSEPVDKRKVTFSIKDEVDTHPSDDSFSNDVVSKPPSGKLSIEQHKRQDSKRDQHKRQDSKRDRVKLTWGKRDAIASAENEIPPAKSSFFKNLMRSRSPSPSKRSPSPTPFLNSDVAKRLSEPLKKSFKNHDQSLRDKFFGTTLSHRDDSSSDDESTDSKSSAQIPSNSSQTTKSSDNSIVTHDWSSQRIESTINTTDDEKSNPRLLVKHQLQLQQQQQQQPVNCNPWKFSLKSSDLNVNFDSYKGEKLFSRDTVTTSVCFSGVHNEQNSRAGGDETDVQPGPKRDVANPIYDSVYEDVRATDGELHLRSVNNSPVPVDRRADIEENPSEESDRHVGSVSKHGKVSGHFASNDTKPPQKLEKSPAECSTGSGISPPKKCAHHVTLGDQRGSEDGSKHEQSSASSNTASIALSSTLTFRSDVQNDSPLISNLNKPQLPHESAQNSAHAELPSTRIPSVGGDLTFLASSSAQMSSDSRRDDDCVSPPKGSNDVTAGKPSMFEGTSGQQVDGVAALFGLRRGVLGRMKMLKQKIEEIEEKERNIENLITRDSMSIDVLEKKKISEKDIKDFFTNATNVLDSLEEEGKKVELQFVEANEYLNRINKTILEMERKKKTQHTSTLSNTVNNNSNNINTDSGCSRADHNGEITCSPSPWNSSNLPKASDTGNPLTSQDAKISSGSSDNSSIFGSFSLLERSTKKSKASSAGSLTLSEKGTPLGMPRNSTCRPLTRYFPVTDSSFDLKCYIESSGHNLDMCKTVFVESYKCFGYLSKMGRKWKKWHRRWFIFDRTKRHLACYLNEPAHQQQQPRSSYYFQSIRDVFADHLHMVKSPNPDFTFCVKLVSKNLFLMASSADAMRIWIDVLFTGAEAYQDVS